MEPLIQERAWLAAATAGQDASIAYLEQLRTIRISIYGIKSQQVEQTHHDIAEATAATSEIAAPGCPRRQRPARLALC